MSRDRTGGRGDRRYDRGASPVVGVVLVVGVTVTLAAVAGALVAIGDATTDPPRATFTATADATDGWPEGQRLRIVHQGGDPVAVADLTVVVTVPRVDVHARLTGFPTRRLTGDTVGGRDVFDGTYAGIDGTLDAAHTDGTWAAGEAASLRVAQGELDLQPGDRVVVRVVHRPSNAVLARLTARASGP